MANLNESSLRLYKEIRRYPSGISRLGSMLSSEGLSVHSPAIFSSEAEAAGDGICSLTTSSSPTNVISVAAFLASSTSSFFCLWEPLNSDFFFNYFLQYGLFTSDFSSFQHRLVQEILQQPSQTAKRLPTMMPGLTGVE